jgi:hypothetical protein
VSRWLDTVSELKKEHNQNTRLLQKLFEEMDKKVEHYAAKGKVIATTLHAIWSFDNSFDYTSDISDLFENFFNQIISLHENIMERDREHVRLQAVRAVLLHSN